MGLMKKLFRGGDTKAAGSTARFQESRAPTAVEQTKSRNEPRRELVKMVLRETMRRHGIPSDWIECRALSVLTKHHKSGMHVQFLVLKADHQLLQWVHAFQESFWEQVLRMDPTAHDWLFSVGWEFYGKSVQDFRVMPDPATWRAEAEAQADFQDTGPPAVRSAGADCEEDLETDLQALQAVMSMPADLTDLPAARPRKHKPPG